MSLSPRCLIMSRSNETPVGVFIVGCGGTGSALFQDLCRFLPHQVDIHLVDGDTCEGKNLQRQHFARTDLGRNKAEALQEKATVTIGLDRIYAHPDYLTRTADLSRITKFYNTIYLIGCVDNHPARRIMETFVRENPMMAIYYIDCANSEVTGEIVACWSYQHAMSGCFRSDLDPRVLTDETGDPTKASCNQQLDDGNIQTLVANRKAAIAGLELVSKALKGEILTGPIYFDECRITRLKAVPTAV